MLLVAIMFLAIAAGCADIEVPDPGKIIRNPIGPDSIKIGMSRSEVLTLDREPDAKTYSVVSDSWEGTREEWFYNARMSALPVNSEYLSEDQYLYFDGSILTKISRSPMGGIKDEIK
jgi:hypothetical protein